MAALNYKICDYSPFFHLLHSLILYYFTTAMSTNHPFLLLAGVLVYEMVMASTPFAPKKADNVTELFTNIAMVTVSQHYESLSFICHCLCFVSINVE